MPQIRTWLLAAGLVVLPGAAPAQQQTPTGFTLGIGVFLNPGALVTDDGDLNSLFLPVGLGNFTIPILVANRIRIEPELGYTKVGSTFEFPDGSSTSSMSVSRYGLNGHVVLFDRGGLRPYAGLRVGTIRASESYAYTSGSFQDEGKRTRSDWYVGAALGGEYFFSPHFSLGGEVQLNRVGIGDEKEDGAPSEPDNDSVTLWSTTGLVGLRLYLF